jgi:hypothetical protein
MSKLYTVAGTSVLNGVRTYRFATGSVRIRVGVLRRNDHTEIELLELPEPMGKDEAIHWLNSQGIDAKLPATGRAGLTAEQKAEIAAQREAERAEAARIAAEAEAAQLAEDAKWIESLSAKV